MKRRKVLWLIKGLGFGGAERLLQRSLPYVDRDKYDYEVAYFLSYKDALVADLEAEGVKVHSLNVGTQMSPLVLPRLVRLLRKVRPDLLHMHLPYAAVTGRVASRLAPVGASIYTEHNVFQRYNRAMSLVHSRTYRMNDGVIFVTDAVGDSVKQRKLLNDSVIDRVIHNGVDTDSVEKFIGSGGGVRQELGIPEEDRLVVTVASLTPKKRHIDLLNAAVSILRDRSDTTFVLVGGGPLEQELKRAVHDLGLEKSVVMTGARDDVLRIVDAADLFVLPSENEGLPISILESMVLGVPIVATAVGGVPDVIENGSDGVLVPAHDSPALASAIASVLDNPELGEKLAAAARQKVYERFTIRRMVAETEAFYEQVLARKGIA